MLLSVRFGSSSVPEASAARNRGSEPRLLRFGASVGTEDLYKRGCVKFATNLNRGCLGLKCSFPRKPRIRSDALVSRETDKPRGKWKP